MYWKTRLLRNSKGNDRRKARRSSPRHSTGGGRRHRHRRPFPPRRPRRGPHRSHFRPPKPLRSPTPPHPPPSHHPVPLLRSRLLRLRHLLLRRAWLHPPRHWIPRRRCSFPRSHSLSPLQSDFHLRRRRWFRRLKLFVSNLDLSFLRFVLLPCLVFFLFFSVLCKACWMNEEEWVVIYMYAPERWSVLIGGMKYPNFEIALNLLSSCFPIGFWLSRSFSLRTISSFCIPWKSSSIGSEFLFDCRRSAVAFYFFFFFSIIIIVSQWTLFLCLFMEFLNQISACNFGRKGMGI